MYRGEKEEIRPFSYRFDPERTEELTQSGALGVLHTLNSRGFITELQIDHGEGRITFGIFPEPEGKDRYRNTERYFTEMLDDRPETGFYTVVNEYLKHGEPCCFLNAREPIRIDFDRIAGEIIASEGLSEEKKPNIVKQICFGVDKLVGCGLLIPADGAADCYRYKTPAIRHELEKEGFALEAYVYYSLFLSGKFDDIRSNVRIKTGERAPGEALEKELDILVTKKGKMGLISCKDTENVSILHIGELRKQADMYGINAVPILVCTQALPEDIHTMCDYVRVGLITVVGPDLPVRITKILTGGGML